MDTDAEIEAAAGKPVSEIFVDDGEDAFRELERAAAQRALSADGAVVALGSGAVLDPDVRQLLAGRPVAFLDAGFAAIARRLGLDRPRVVIPGNPRGRLRTMLEERQPVYQQLATFTVAADELAPEEVADEIEAWLTDQDRPLTTDQNPAATHGNTSPMSITRIPVAGERPYDVVIGTGVLSELPGLVGPEATKVVVIHPRAVGDIARPACRALDDAGYQVIVAEVPDGEAAKTASAWPRALWSRLAAEQVGRRDCIVGIGGGAATDLAGFVAATLAARGPGRAGADHAAGMVDAAVGGKTAIDIPEGKNLVGAFYPPAGVLADLATLETVPRPTTWPAWPR